MTILHELSEEEYARNRKERVVRYFEEQKGICAYCGIQMTLELNKPNTAEIEHIIPKSHRHIKGKFNEVAACRTCNRIKGDKPLHEVIYLLKTRLDEANKPGEGNNNGKKALKKACLDVSNNPYYTFDLTG